VDETANLQYAAKKIVWGKMAWADNGAHLPDMLTSMSP